MEIGQGSGSLFCLTNKTNCCDAHLGSWILPNGNKAATPDESDSSVNQHYGIQSVQLERQREPIEGIYLCNISDADSEVKQLYVGVYASQQNSRLRYL